MFACGLLSRLRVACSHSNPTYAMTCRDIGDHVICSEDISRLNKQGTGLSKHRAGRTTVKVCFRIVNNMWFYRTIQKIAYNVLHMYVCPIRSFSYVENLRYSNTYDPNAPLYSSIL